MMKVLPMRWHSTRRREQIRVELEAITRAWLSAWHLGNADFVLEADGGRTILSGDMWMEADADGVCLLAGCKDQALGALGCALAGIASCHAHPIATAIGRRALEDYACMVLARPGLQAATNWMSFVHESKREPRHGVVAFRIALNDADIWLYLNDRLCDALVPVSAGRRGALVPRLAALSSKQIVVQATLNLGKFDIERVKQLRPGEILRTQTLIGAHATLSHNGFEALGSGPLVRVDGRRALKLESTNHIKEAVQ